MSKRVFGNILKVPIGKTFINRKELHKSRVHLPPMSGISGSQTEGAESIVLSGGYEDDEDYGEIIIYTGHGGNDPKTKKQVADQKLTRQNKALALNMIKGLPLRVIRGSKHKSIYSPKSGYRYDGLYSVESYWKEKGNSGFTIWRFRLTKIEEDRSQPTEKEKHGGEPSRFKYTILRIVRDTKMAKQIKILYNFTCQVCGERLEGTAGAYAEAAHVKPLGRPHNGPDVEENVICLCPNHHVLFDIGGISVNDDLSIIGYEGKLILHKEHKLNNEYLAYHREHYLLD